MLKLRMEISVLWTQVMEPFMLQQRFRQKLSRTRVKSCIVSCFGTILLQTEKLQNEDEIKIQLPSKILTISVGKEKIENLTSPILFNFKKTKKISPKDSRTVNHLCNFWDPSIRKTLLSDLPNGHFQKKSGKVKAKEWKSRWIMLKSTVISWESTPKK